MTEGTWNALTPEQIRFIVRLRAGGCTYRDIHEATGHCNDTIHKVLLDHGLAGTYTPRPPKPEPEALFAEGQQPARYACPRCGGRAERREGHDTCRKGNW
jgi:hypothetical protein